MKATFDVTSIPKRGQIRGHAEAQGVIDPARSGQNGQATAIGSAEVNRSGDGWDGGYFSWFEEADQLDLEAEREGAGRTGDRLAEGGDEGVAALDAGGRFAVVFLI